MLEFRWRIAGDAQEHEVRLRMHSAHRWITPKSLWLDNGPVFRRGFFAGIDSTFPVPGRPGSVAHLFTTYDPQLDLWFPALTVDGQAQKELNGARPSRVPRRPKSLAITTGVVYLLMLMVVVMSPHIEEMLHASYSHSDTRTLILPVALNTPEPADRLRIVPTPIPPATPGAPYEAALAAEGGTPPYKWTQVKGKLPTGLTLGENGVIRGTPTRAPHVTVWFRVTDAAGNVSRWPFVFSAGNDKNEEPAIVERKLPTAVLDQPYEAAIAVRGGVPKLHWTASTRRLPPGIKLDMEKGAFVGTPTDREGLSKEEQTQWLTGTPIRVRVYDSSYSPSDDMSPWFAPFGVIAVCLLGFWCMRRWSVIALGILIAAQVALGLGVSAMPLSWAAIVVQGFLLLLGIIHFGKMR